MLQGNEHYVIVKLTSGEQLMAVLEHESENKIHLVYPMLIRMVPTIANGKAHEHVTATPYYQFSDDANISINKQHVIYVKNLHHMLISHFTTLVEENENKVIISRDKAGAVKAEDLTWEEELHEELEELTSEEIQERIDMLESILSDEEEEPIEEQSKVFVAGNKTLH